MEQHQISIQFRKTLGALSADFCECYIFGNVWLNTLLSANIFTKLQFLISVFRSQEKKQDMLSRTLKLATYPMDPIAYLKKDWYVSLVHLTQYYFSFLIGSLNFFFQFLPSETKSTSLKEHARFLKYYVLSLAWPNPEKGLHEHLVCLSL